MSIERLLKEELERELEFDREERERWRRDLEKEQERERYLQLQGLAKPNDVQDLPSNAPTPTISSLLAASEIIAYLADRGCNNLTSHLNLSTRSQYPVSSGGFSDIYSCELHNNTKVAIKALRALDSDGLPLGKYQKRAARELYAWSKCNHSNVARLLGFAEFQGRLAMISEWAEHGTLLGFLSKHPNANRCALSASICAGLAYLHKKGIVHGDLKSANVLVSSDETPMLADFGNASLSESTVHFTRTESTSFSLRWTAPEILKEEASISPAADIYALGMTILETFTGQVPFTGVRDVQIYGAVVEKKRTPPRPEAQIPSRSVCGNILWVVLMSCWSYEPELRPSAAEVKRFIAPLTPQKLVPVEVGENKP